MSEYLEGRLRRLERRVEELAGVLDRLLAALQTSAEDAEDPVAASFRRFQRSADVQMGRS